MHSYSKCGYQPRPNVVKDKKGGLITDRHGILARWRNHFSRMLNIHEVNEVRQTELHITEPLVPEPGILDV
jgi:ferric iron reductase protein FhuF